LKYARQCGNEDVYSWALANGCPKTFVSEPGEDDFDESEDDFDEGEDDDNEDDYWLSEDEDSNDSDQGDDEDD
jgi:hypothetical protein